jgi:hypothetical protein
LTSIRSTVPGWGLGVKRISRALLLCAVALGAIAVVPAGAGASPRQTSIIEDDAVFLGLTARDPGEALGEARGLGADAVRVVLSWRRAAPISVSRIPPVGFDASNPDSQGYNWGPYDTLMARAREHGLKVILDISPAIPYWGSSEPSRCPHYVGGRAKNGLGCYWKPDPRKFAQFATAVARRYKGKVALYSIWNEPNLEDYLYPQKVKTKAGTVDFAAKRFRELWIAGYKAIRKVEPKMGKRVLFGETAAISSPRDTLFAALCLNRKGRPYPKKQRKLQGCTKPGRLPIGGLSVHPYNQSALGNVFTSTKTRAAMTMGYLSRATRLLKLAEKYKRVPKGRGIYVTETGFQSRPPDPRGLALETQAQAINEADQLFYDDPRIKSTAQFELFDVPDQGGSDIFNTGLRMEDGTAKPALDAYRLPLVVTRRGAGRVEVWGQVRPAAGRTRPVIEVASAAVGPFTRLKSPRTNGTGYFRFGLRRRGAAKLFYRMTWHGRHSRVAKPGRRIAYREKLPK